jgi:hypothetical protein
MVSRAVVGFVAAATFSCLSAAANTLAIDVSQYQVPEGSARGLGQEHSSARAHPMDGYHAVTLGPGDALYEKYMKGDYAAVTPEAIVDAITSSQDGDAGSSDRRRSEPECTPEAQPRATRKDL